MDLLGDVARAQQSVAADVARQRRAVADNVRDLEGGPRRKRQRRIRSINPVPPCSLQMSNKILEEVGSDAETSDSFATDQTANRAGLARRLWRWLRRIPIQHTHRFVKDSRVPTFGSEPSAYEITTVFEAKPSEYEKTLSLICAGRTGKLRGVLFGGILLIELDAQTFVLSGADLVERV